jgi:hypothetical protein
MRLGADEVDPLTLGDNLMSDRTRSSDEAGALSRLRRWSRPAPALTS